MSITLFDLQAILSANISPFESAMNQAESKADSTAKDIAASFTRMGKAIDGAFQDAQGRWREATGRFMTDAEKAARGIEDSFEQAFRKLGIKSQAELNKAAQEAQNAYQLIAKSGKASAEDLIRAQAAVDKAIKATSSGLGDEAKKIESAWSRIGSAIKSAAGEMQAAGLAISASITAPLAAIGAVVVKTGIDFQSSMNMLQAASGATGAQMEELRSKAVQLGADLSLPATSANDAGRAMLELNKAGLSVADTMDAAKGTLQLAAAASVDEARAAEIAATALNAFHLAGSEAGRVADLLAAAANASLGSINDMALAMQQSSASAAALKIPVQDLITSIGLMAQSGIKGSDAGTSLKTMFAALTPSTEKAAKAMKQLGIDAFDSQGKFIGLENVIKQAAPALAKMTDEQKAFTIEAAFGSDAMRAANIVLGQGVQAFDAMSVAVNRSGAAQDLAGAKARGLGGAIDGLKSQLETIALAFSELVAGPLEGIVRNIAELAPKVALAAVAFAQANPQIVAFGVTVVGVTAIIGPLLLALGSIVAFIGGPFTIALIAAIGTVSALVYAYITDTGQMRTQTIGLIDDLTKAWQSMGLNTSNALEAVSFAVGVFVDTIVGPINAVIGLLRFLVQGAQAAAYGFIAAFKALQGDLGGAMIAIGEIAKVGAQNTKKASVDGLGGLSEGWGYRLNEVRSMLASANSQYASLGLQAGNNYVNGVKRAMASLPGLSQPPVQGFADRAKSGGFNFGAPTNVNKLSGYTEQYKKDLEILAKSGQSAGKALEGAFGGAGKAAGGAKKEVNEVLNAVNDYLRKSKSSLTISEAAWKGLTDAERKYFVDAKNAYNQHEITTQTLAAKLTTGFAKVGSSLAVSIEDGKIRIRQSLIEIARDVDNLIKGGFLGTGVNAKGIVIPARIEFSETQDYKEALNRSYLDILKIQTDSEDAMLASNARYHAELTAQGERNNKEYLQVMTRLRDNIKSVVGDGIGNILLSLSDKFKWNLEQVKGWASDIDTVIGAMPGKFGEMARGVYSSLQHWTSFINGILSILNKLNSAIPSSIGGAIESIAGIFKQGQQSISTSLEGIKYSAASVSEDIADTMKFASKESQAAFSGISNSANQTAQNVDKAARAMVASIAAVATFAATRNQGKFAGILGGAAAGAQIGSLFGPVGTLVGSGVGAIAGLFGSGKSAAQKRAEEEAKQRAGLDMQKLAADILSSQMEGLKKGMEFLQSLEGFTAVPRKTIKRFMNEMELVLTLFAEMAGKFKAESIEASKALAEAFAPIVDVIGNGVNSLTALGAYTGIAKSAITSFFSDLKFSVELMGALAEQIENGLQKRAMKFSDRIKSVVELIGTGAESLSKLLGFAKAPKSALEDFGAEIENAVKILAGIADKIDISMSKNAARFAERAGAVATLIGNGVAGFLQLSTFKAIPADIIRSFFEAVTDASYLLAQTSSLVSSEMMDNAANFAEKAKGVFEIINGGMSAFKDLATFKAAPDEMVQALANQIQMIVSVIGNAVSKMDTAAQQSAQSFAARMISVFEFIKLAVETITSINSIQAFEATIWDNFLIYIGRMVETLGQSISLMDKATQLAAMFKGLADAMRVNVFAGIDSVRASAQALSALLAGSGGASTASIRLEATGGADANLRASGGVGAISPTSPITQYNSINIDPRGFRDVQEMLDWVSTMFGSAGQFPQAAHAS